jgi:putative ABC transport system permease protein
LIVEGTWNPSKAIPPLHLYGAADAGYFRTLQIPLLAGRLFDPPETQRWNEAIINQETAKRMFGDSTGQRILGKRFQLLPGGSLYTVIGVVGSIRDTSLFGPPSGAAFMPEVVTQDSIEGQFTRTMAIVARTTRDLDATTRALREAVADIDPTLPTFDMAPMPAVVRASIARLSFTMTVLGIAAAVTLLLGIVGVYGIIAYAVTLRTRELGVRLALGAAPSSIAAMIARNGVMLAGVGVVVGIALSLVVARFMRAFLFEVAPADPLTIVSASLVLVASALVASWLPAMRAARLNPVDTLRAE